MRLRTILAIYAAKLTSLFIKLMRRGAGATLPGYAAYKIDPNILSVMSKMVSKHTIVVMGTNGKTTTNSILNHVLSAQGKTVISNRTGANMQNGIIAAFALSADWKGKIHTDYACIEVDENESIHVLSKLKPDCIIVTNLSRDQLDRYGEVDLVRDKVLSAIKSVPDALLVLNSDDVISYAMSYDCPNPVITYGIGEQIFDSRAGAGSRESIFCSRCGAKLEYDIFYYGHLGIWHCPNCEADHPAVNYLATNITQQEESYSFSVGSTHIHTNAHAPYNVYNTLAAFCALCALRITKPQAAAAAIGSFNYQNNRELIVNIRGSRFQLHLSKNPIGFQQKISLVLKDSKPKDVIIQINDTAQDGKDISWLWDVDFQFLADSNAASITLAGSRRYDMGLRLKYEDIPHSFTTDMKNTIQTLAENGTGNVYIIVNYSGLYQINHLLQELQTAP